MTKEQLEEALKKEIEEISKEFPFLKDGLAGYGEYCMMELAQGICHRLGFGDYDPYTKYIDKKIEALGQEFHMIDYYENSQAHEERSE